jgi:hypothetical protein
VRRLRRAQACTPLRMCTRAHTHALLGGRSTGTLDGMSSVYVVKAHCVSADPDTSPDADGAYVNVYTTAPSEHQAESTAVSELTASGWRCLKIIGIERHTRRDYEGDSDGLEYFEQALLDGTVLVAHTYPRKGLPW